MRTRTPQFTLAAIVVLLATMALGVSATRQSQPERQRTALPTVQATPPEPSPEVETLKTDTNLVTVPVIVTDTTSGLYLPDLQQGDFNLFEDGKRQEIAFFATVSAPFHVVLMLDTSASTEANLDQIQAAATAFVNQLQTGDLVKVISFDDEVRDLCEFTDDRKELKTAIAQTRPGKGTKLYDAFALAMSQVRKIKGRKAVVLFTDGVDYHSDEATFDDTLRRLDEEDVIVYPVRYDTRAETEKIARATMGEPQSLPTIGVLRHPSTGTTPTTFPSDDPRSGPPSGSAPPSTGVSILADILRGRSTTTYPSPDPNNGNWPPVSGPTSRTDPRNSPRGNLPGQPGDSVGAMLDQLYLMADSYLKALADKSGGRLLRADRVSNLPEAFASIAAELRTQYSLGYYPTNAARDGRYRKIKVTTSRKNAAVRARPGYSAPGGLPPSSKP